MTTEFTKFRYGGREAFLRWDFVDRDGGGIDVRCRPDDEESYLVGLVGQGARTNAAIAERTRWLPTKVSRIAAAA